MSGSWTSMSTSDGPPRRARASASSPVLAASTEYPRMRSSAQVSLRLFSLSSTTRTAGSRTISPRNVGTARMLWICHPVEMSFAHACDAHRTDRETVMRRRRDVGLRRLEVFRSCTDREISRILSLADQIPVAAGHVIIRWGERTREFYVLLEGKASVTRGTQILGV